MNLIMARPNSAAAHNSRRAFFGLLSGPIGDILDREFDQDDRPLTGEPLDWHTTRHWPVIEVTRD